MTLVGVGHALADAFAFVGEDVPKSLGLHPGSFNRVPDYRMRAILATLRHKSLMAGGSAANTVKLAARLGVDAHFVGQCGHDEPGLVFESELLEAGVKVNLTKSDAPTGLCITFLCPSQDRTVATFRSASGDLALGLVNDTILMAADVVVVEGYLLDELPFLDDLLSRCVRLKKAVAFDTGDGLGENQVPALKRHLASGVIRYLFLRESDAASLTGLDAEGALKALSNEVEVVVLQRGDRGWLTLCENRLVAVPLEGSLSVDPSGASDGFEAGFLWSLSQGWPVLEACRAGSLVAACVVEQPGTRIDSKRWEHLIATLAACRT